MNGHYGLRCWVTEVPWMDRIEVRLAGSYGNKQHHAIGVTNGQILWEEHESGSVVEPFMYLGREELEAFARAIGERTQTNDETRAALKDTRETRDRLLSLVEKVVERS